MTEITLAAHGKDGDKMPELQFRDIPNAAENRMRTRMALQSKPADPEGEADTQDSSVTT
jgi:hypothetical protein